MEKFIRIGIDLAKNYFQVHALESEDGQATIRKLSRQAMRKFFSEMEPCLVGMEACGSALLSQTKGFRARTFGDGSRFVQVRYTGLACVVRLIPPIYVKPYVKRGPRTTRPTRRQSSRGHVAPRPCDSCRSSARRNKQR